MFPVRAFKSENVVQQTQQTYTYMTCRSILFQRERGKELSSEQCVPIVYALDDHPQHTNDCAEYPRNVLI